MDTFTNFVKTFATLFSELAVLFIFISFLVSLIQQMISEERIKSILNRPKKWSGYLYGTGLGALTPFCSCSTIPILAGLLSSGAPFGPSMSFLIASLLLNPIIIILLWVLLGWKLTMYYVVAIFFFSILIGITWKALGLEQSVKDMRVRKGETSNELQNISKWKLAFRDAWSFFYPLLPFLFLGVLIGAFIYDYVPQDLIVKYAGSDKLHTIPIA